MPSRGRQIGRRRASSKTLFSHERDSGAACVRSLEMQECPRGAPWRKAPERARSIPCAKAARCARVAIAPMHVEHVERRSFGARAHTRYGTGVVSVNWQNISGKFFEIWDARLAALVWCFGDFFLTPLSDLSRLRLLLRVQLVSPRVLHRVNVEGLSCQTYPLRMALRGN